MIEADDAVVFNDDEAITVGEDSDAIKVTGDRAAIDNAPNGIIDTGGSNSKGIAVTGDDADIDNAGSLKTSCANSDGIVVTGDNAEVDNANQHRLLQCKWYRRDREHS